MNDLISREKLLNEINLLKKSPWYNKDFAAAKIVRKDAVAAVEMCIKEAPSVSQWISIKDRMPEKSVPVLICATGHRVTAYYDKVEKVFRLTEDENLYYLTEYVTHWMPLPEPPESRDEDV